MNPRSPAAAQVMRVHPDTEVADRLLTSHREFRAIVEHRVGSRALAEGILQDAFVHADEELHASDDDETAVDWFLRVLRATLMDTERRHEVSTQGLRALISELDEASGGAPELRRMLARSMARLGQNLHPMYARALVRVEFEGASAQAYAAEIGVRNHNAVVVRVFLAREALKQQVRLSCMTPAKEDSHDQR